MQVRKAFIVDDETDTCFLLTGILKQQGFETAFVHSLGDAKLALQTSMPDVIFLDNHLRDGHGIEFIPHLIENYPALKIIVITAFDTDHDKQHAYMMGAHHFMGKPFNKKIICDAITEVFR